MNKDKVADTKPAILETFLSLRREPTDDPHLFRMVDQEGDWTHYFHEQYGYLTAVNHILHIGFPMGWGLVEWLRKTPAEESEKIFKSAGERGSKVHMAIRDLIMGVRVHITNQYPNDDGKMEQLTAKEWECLRSFIAWCALYKPRVHRAESAVFNAKLNYAGTTDFQGEITIPAGQKISIDGGIVAFKKAKTIFVNPLDWKTSSAVRDDHKLQVGAYNACLGSKGYTGVVRFGTTHKNGGFEMKLWTHRQTLEHFGHFLEAKSIYSMVEGERTPEIEEIPTSLAVQIPIIKKGG